MIEFSLALPLEQKMRDGYNRSIMRRAMNGLLPPLVQSRVEKGCLTVNFTKGMHDQTETLIKNIFESAFFQSNDYINVDEFKKNAIGLVVNPY
jgi:asparagine synthase (glutamine-hydrolysing)